MGQTRRLAAQLLRGAALLVASVVALTAILAMLEHILVYHPHPYRANYQNLLPPGMVELEFKIGAGHQSAFYKPPTDGAKLPSRLWAAFCGNGSLALDWLPLITQDQNEGDGFLLVDYPGYGKSEGWSNIPNTQAAAEGALVSLGNHLGVEATLLEPHLNTIGHSLGAAAALDFAVRHAQVQRIILLAPFTSMREEAALFVGTPLSHLLAKGYDNRAALRQLAQRQPPPQVIIFHGLRDGMIPAAMGHELAAQFPTFVTFRPVADGTHDTVVAEAADEILPLLGDRTAAPGRH